MYPSNPADPATGARRARRRLRLPLILAVSASLFGASAVATTASGANSGSSATHEAAAATPTRFAKTLPSRVTGHTVDGKRFSGKFLFRRFVVQNGKMFAVGILQGALAGQPVNQRVFLPVTGGSNLVEHATTHGLTSPAQATPGACSILTLDLGPVDLNLLGLRVFLDEVHLLIEAIPGAGNLLGNLLCSVAGLLDGGLLSGLSQVTGLLNSITQLLNTILGVA